LPKNQGHVVIETVRPDSGLHMTLNLLDALSEGVGLVAHEKDKQKVPYFQFEGKDPRPVASGPAITVLFVGSAPTAQPPVELAPCELLKDGRRRILIMRPSPDTISFGETRLAAYVRQAAAGCVLLTTTSALEPGPYVFNADARMTLMGSSASVLRIPGRYSLGAVGPAQVQRAIMELNARSSRRLKTR
jgi:hypothetical protein